MRKSLWVMLALLFLAIGPPAARANDSVVTLDVSGTMSPVFTSDARAGSFTPNFTTTGCTGSCLLAVAADVTFPSPTIMVADFGGVQLPTLIPSGNAPGDLYTWDATYLPSINVAFFELFDVTQGFPPITCTGMITPTLDQSCGTLTFTPVVTPEPNSGVLWVLAVGLMFVMRKRIWSLPQAS
jgi:hypothetical protein